MRVLSALLLLAACASEPVQTSRPAEPADAAPSGPSQAVASAGEVNDPRWHATLRTIAGGYQKWGRVEDEMRWAPFLCKMPLPARARLSDSGDDTTHGRKLYTLYARDPEAYGARMTAMVDPEAPALADVSQVLVKEAWLPVVSDVPVDGELGGERREGLRPAQRDGKAWVPGERAGLFVIFKPTQAGVDTDAGWVYGTIAADLKTVTSAGKVASCMGCHQEAAKGRLFGLPADSRAAG